MTTQHVTASADSPSRTGPGRHSAGPVARPATGPGPISSRHRSLAPDLARGAMLLFIAVANVECYLYGRTAGYGYRPVDGGTLDRLADLVVTVFVSERSYPMFAILFGYGMAVMVRRMTARGAEPRRARGALARRGAWLIVFGVVHAALLWDGDILAVYGATCLVALSLVHRRRAVLLRWSVPSALVLTANHVINAIEQSKPWEREAGPDYLAGVLDRGVGHLLFAVEVVLVIPYIFLLVIGFLVARAGWLDRPQDHVATLRRVAVTAMVVNLVGGLPHALTVARLYEPPRPVGIALVIVHHLVGVFTGLGYLCLFALLAARLRRVGRSGVVAGVAAVGERSLTCYLLQSMVFAPLLSAWGFGLGARIGTAQAYAIGVAVWLATVLVAVGLARAGRRGPFEVLLRRLTYGRSGHSHPLRVKPRNISAQAVNMTASTEG